MLEKPISNDGIALDAKKFKFDYVVGEEYSDTKGALHSGLSLMQHKCSNDKSAADIQSMSEDFHKINPELPMLSHFIESLNKVIRNSTLDDEVYRIELCKEPKQVEENKHPSNNDF